MAKVQVIEIACGDWSNVQRKPVVAIVIGKVAVYCSGRAAPEWRVVHVQSGTRIAAYSVEHVALNFAKRIDALCDWDTISPHSKERTQKQQALVDRVARMRQHETFMPSKKD